MKSIALVREEKMQNPYNRYQSIKETAKPKKEMKKSSRKPINSSSRRKAKSKKTEAMVFNIPILSLCLFGFLLSFYIFTYTDEVMDIISRIHVGMTQSVAADEEKSAIEDTEKGAKNSPLPVGKVSALKSDADHLTMKNANVYKALKDKRRELEKKERRLAQLEEDLQLQKEEIEKQLKEMQEMRRNISSKLDKKVVADQESIDKLVGVYSSMKPQKAAKILSQLDDALAIQVLGKMKKQNAAAILNYIEPKKAQYLSEKFTGLKK